MSSTLTGSGWYVDPNTVDARMYPQLFTTAQIASLNAAIAAGGGNDTRVGTRIIEVSTGTIYVKKGVGTAARFVVATTGGGAPAVPALAIAGQSFSTVSGTPTTATVAGDPVLQFADGATTEVANTFTAPAVGGFECFLYLSGTIATTGNVAMAFDIQNTTSGVTPAAGPDKLFAVNIAAANTVARYQIPAGALRPDNVNTDFRLRLQRVGANGNDTYTGVLSLHKVEFVKTADIAAASVTQAGTVAPTITPTVYNGNGVRNALSIYTPLWTSTDAVYFAAPVTISSTQQSRLAKLDKTTLAPIQDVQLGTTAHDAIYGHRDASVCVDSTNTVISHRAAHHQPWAGRKYAGADLSLLVGTAVPTGLDINCSYRRFFRNPFDGSIWMGVRGNSYQGCVYKWDTTTQVFTPKPSFSLAGSNSQSVGAYGLEIAFGSATEIYVSVEPFRGVGVWSGFPRQNVNVIKSADGGATWQTMSGKTMNAAGGPAAYPGNDDDIAFPSYNAVNNIAQARLVMGADNTPIVISDWQHPDDTFRSLWMSKYDSANKKWVRTRIMAHNGAISIGNPHAIYTGGKILVTVSSTDGHDASGADIIPENNQVYLFTSTDSGATWKRYTLTHPVGGYSGAYLDPESIRIDNVLRMKPCRESDPTAVEIWTMPTPA